MLDDHSAATLYRFVQRLHNLDQTNIPSWIDAVLREVATLSQTQYVYMLLLNPDQTPGVFYPSEALRATHHVQAFITTEILPTLIQTHQPVWVSSQTSGSVWHDDFGVPHSGSALALGLCREANLIGVLLIGHESPTYFDGQCQAMLEAAATDVGCMIRAVLERDDLRTRSWFDQAVVPIILTDLEGYILEVNSAASQLIGSPAAALIDSPIDVLHPKHPEALSVSRLRSIPLDEEIAFRTELSVNGGSQTVPVLVRLRHRQHGGHSMIELIEYDLSAQAQMERLRDDMTAMVYHDLRNPLQAIDIAIQKLARVLANHENAVVWTMLQGGLRASRQMRRMIDGLLDIQRMEEGKAILNLQSTDLRVMIADAVQLVQPLAMDAGQRFKFQIAADLPQMCLDSDMMMRVLINLLENAIKYTPDNGTIIVNADLANAGNDVRISVQDTGPGIPRNMQREVFDKFSRVKYQDAPKGLGLGLAFCRLAVEVHGGDIWVESEPNQGSEFIFTLPVTSVPVSGDKVVAC